MATARITKRAVDAAKARKIDSYVWDPELPGFGLKVTPAGRKVYLVQYRLGGRKGRTRRVTIGQHGPDHANRCQGGSQAFARRRLPLGATRSRA